MGGPKIPLQNRADGSLATAHALKLGYLDQASPDYRSYLVDAVTDDMEALPTPPPSQSPPETIVSMSTAFFPGSHAIGYNVILSSSEFVLFYVHTNILREMSHNAFHTALSENFTKPGFDSPIVPVNESSNVLDAMLHILYRQNISTRNPSLSITLTAIDHMPVYGLNPKDYVFPRTINFNYFLSFVPQHPLEVYTLAGHHDLIELAAAASSHLLSYPLSQIDDVTAMRMGSVYLRRLFSLQWDRLEVLKEILLVPPYTHPQTRNCSFADQKRITRAWALVAAHLVWDASPGLSPTTIKTSFETLDERIHCAECQRMVRERIKDVVTRWACAKHTI